MTTTEARSELTRRTEGALTDSIGAALEYLDSEDAVELIEQAKLDALSSHEILTKLTGVSV